MTNETKLNKEGEVSNTQVTTDWKQMLKLWNLDKFIDEFAENGWEDIRDWHNITNDDLISMKFKKGHICRFERFLNELNLNNNKNNLIINNNNSKYLLGGNSFIELGLWRIGRVDNSHFSFSHKISKYTSVIFRSDGTIHPGNGKRKDYGLWDRKIEKLKNVIIGDGYIQFGSDWHIGMSGNCDHLSISHISQYTCMIWRSDGTRHPGNGKRKDWNDSWKRITNKNGKVFGTYIEKNIKSNVKWIQFGDNFRMGDFDSGHFSISSNIGCNNTHLKTCVIYRNDGTIHPGPRNDYGLWKNNCVKVELLN